jgi:hypothetical protein
VRNNILFSWYIKHFLEYKKMNNILQKKCLYTKNNIYKIIKMDEIYISLGCNCSTDYNLRRLNKNVITSPFSWARIPKISKLLTILTEKINIDIYANSLKIISYSHIHPSLLTLYEEKQTGSFILKNNYGITFAHEIINKYKLPHFKEIVEQRIDRFYSLKNEKIKFIRYESSTIKNIDNYLANIYSLIEILSKDFKDFNLILIVPFKHDELSVNIGDNTIINVKFLYYDISQFVDWKQEAVYDKLSEFI